MQADRPDAAAPRPATDDARGLVVKATRRGALVLETENARRMMRRLAKLRPGSEPAARPEEPGPATAAP